MRIRNLFIITLLLILLFWMGSIFYSSLLTETHKEEFSDFATIGFDFMHPWEGEPDFRVLSYSSEKARVYYFADTGGEVALFLRQDGKWVFRDTSSIWSNYGGSADDYFAWPYFKDYVPSHLATIAMTSFVAVLLICVIVYSVVRQRTQDRGRSCKTGDGSLS